MALRQREVETSRQRKMPPATADLALPEECQQLYLSKFVTMSANARHQVDAALR